MPTWKEITVEDLSFNQNDLDMRKMYKAGAILIDHKYPALEIDCSESVVTVLARLETGFEEYIVFERDHYDSIPELEYH